MTKWFLGAVVSLGLGLAISGTLPAVIFYVFAAGSFGNALWALFARVTERYRIEVHASHADVIAGKQRLSLPLPIKQVGKSEHTRDHIRVVHEDGEVEFNAVEFLPFKREEAIRFLLEAGGGA